MFSFGEFKADDQEKMLRDLNKKVSDVYRSCIGDNEANIRYVTYNSKMLFTTLQFYIYA